MMNANDLSASLVALLDLAAGLSTSVKVAWVILPLWAVAQAVWYRRIRVEGTTPASGVRKATRRRTARKRAAPADTAVGVVVPDVGLSAQMVDTSYR